MSPRQIVAPEVVIHLHRQGRNMSKRDRVQQGLDLRGIARRCGISAMHVWRIVHHYKEVPTRRAKRVAERPTLCPCGSKLAFRVMPMTGTVVEECRAGCRGSRKLVAA
jgi:hypothetical protein